MLTINWSVDRTGKTFSLSVSVIEIYLIHNISAPDIVFSTYNNISPPNCAIILHFALNFRRTVEASTLTGWQGASITPFLVMGVQIALRLEGLLDFLNFS